MDTKHFAEPLSLFGGSERIVEDHFGLTTIHGKRPLTIDHWSALRKLDENPPLDWDGQPLVELLHAQVARNWNRCIEALTKLPSQENWRWPYRSGYISSLNTSPEVTLERAIIAAAIADGRDDWSNQVPISSGMIGSGEKRRCVDLVHKRGAAAFDLVELKVGSNNPLYAAVEIIQYGLAWLISRRHRDVLGYTSRELVEANDIHCQVLAPPAYYRGLNLRWLERGLDHGLRTLGERDGVRLGFEFQSLPHWFELPAADPAVALRALDQRAAVFRD
jgi:hypothetical protein